jgi:hypothetical protein
MNKLVLTVFSLVAAVAAGDEIFYRHPDFTVYANRVERDGYTATVDPANGSIRSPASFDYKSFGRPPFKPMERVEIWTPESGLDSLPNFKSEFPMVDAVYQMALQNVLDMVNMKPEGVLNASEGRPPWVRDTSYVVLDGMSWFFPSACRKSLEHTADQKTTVKPEQMHAVHAAGVTTPGVPTLQPCYAMSDFAIWIPAAMEYATATGDRAFLEQYYDCMCRTVELIRNEKFDPVDGLYDGGETIGDGSIAYPENTAGLASLKGASVNLIQYAALRTLVRAGDFLNKPAAERELYQRQAARLDDEIKRQLWLKNRGFYALLKQDRQLHPVERASAMANAFSILFHEADPQQQADILKNFPDQKWGAPVLWPAWMNRMAYHDQNLWPNVDANWAMAAALAGDPDRLTKSLAVLTENAAFELGFNEMINLFRGDHRGRKPQLWAATGFLRMIVEGVFGLESHPQGLMIQPNVPQVFSQGVTLSGLHSGSAVLNIRLNGSGSYIRSFLLDGKTASNLLPSGLVGKHTIDIVMIDRNPVTAAIPFDVPEGDGISVQADTGELLVLFGETGGIQKLAPVSAGRFVINWPDQAVVDRIMVQAADSGSGRQGRWQMINVLPALDVGCLPGVFEETRPLTQDTETEVVVHVRNNRAAAADCTVQLSSANPLIACPAQPVLVQVPAGSETQVVANVGLKSGLSYGTWPVTVVVSTGKGTTVQSVYTVKIAETQDFRGLWMMKATEQANAASPDLYDITDGWDFVRLPQRWKDIEKHKDYNGPMWYRRTLLVPSAWKGHDLEFYVGVISGEDTVFFNGENIGSGSGGKERRYRIPAGIVKPGDNNVLAVQVNNKNKSPKCGMTDWPIALSVVP